MRHPVPERHSRRHRAALQRDLPSERPLRCRRLRRGPAGCAAPGHPQRHLQRHRRPHHPHPGPAGEGARSAQGSVILLFKHVKQCYNGDAAYAASPVFQRREAVPMAQIQERGSTHVYKVNKISPAVLQRGLSPEAGRPRLPGSGSRREFQKGPAAL